MRVYSSDFSFNGITAASHGLCLCSFDGTAELTNAGSTLEFTTAKAIGSYKWYSYGHEYAEPLSFTIHIVKKDYSSFTMSEKAMIARWLLRIDGYKPFQFGTGEYMDIIFNARGESMKEIVVGQTQGIEVNFVCESPFGFTPVTHKKFKITGDNQQFLFNNDSEEIGYIYPSMKITIDFDCDLTIINQSDANRATTIRDCKAGEIITLNNELKIISTTIPLLHDIQNCFNYQWFRFYRGEFEQDNKLLISGQCTIELEYQLIRKIGVGE